MIIVLQNIFFKHLTKIEIIVLIFVFIKLFSVLENGKSISQSESCFKLFSNPQTNKIEKETLLNIIHGADYYKIV